MKKGLYILTALILTASLSQSVQADVAVTTANGVTTVAQGTGTNAPPAQTFDVSTNVRITGGSSPTSFLIAGHHTDVVAKKSGKQFAMTADNNTMFFRDISETGDTANIYNITDTNSDDLGGTDWVTM